MSTSAPRSLWHILLVSLLFSIAFIDRGHAAESKPSAQPARAAEDFKGEPPATEVTFGALGGLGIINSRAGFSLLGTAAKKIVNKGFAPDINNQVFIEVQAGPMFLSGGPAFVYSAHLRWDFPKDEQWTLYALGGLGGYATGADLGSQWLLFPRFGVGAMMYLNDNLSLRAEVSHELIATGVSFAF